MSEIETLHVPFARFLDDEGIPYSRARSDRESTIALGEPDFSLKYNDRCLHIEFKTKAGKLSPAQVKRIAYLRGAGNTVLILRDLELAVETVSMWKTNLGAPKSSPPEKAPPVENLFTHGAGVWRKDGAGMVRVRTATPADANLPHLSAA